MVIGILIGVPMMGGGGNFTPPIGGGNCDGTHLDFSCDENSGHIVSVGL